MSEKIYLTPWQKVVRGVDGNTVEPLRSTDVAQFYWCSEINVSEISEAYFDGKHANTFMENVGPALLKGKTCLECQGPIHVFSRQDAINSVGRSRRRCRTCANRIAEYSQAEFRERRQKEDQRIRELKFMPYSEYLKTPEWQQTRQSALRRARFMCQTCSAGGTLHVHHRTYARRGTEYSSDVIVLCADCHETFHERRQLAEGGRAA